MLRTTNRLVTDKLKAHVLENFEPENYGGSSDTRANLYDQINYMRYGGRTIYQTALDYVEGGSLLVYYGDVRDFLRDALQETEEESNRYSDDKAWKLYCHLMARTLSQLYMQYKHELRRSK